MTSDKVSNKLLPWVVALAMFMQSLDGTILNTALPSIAENLHRSPLEIQSIIIAYVLTLALLIPLSGWLSDKFGSRNIFIIAVAIFTLGSLACAFSKTLEMLVFMRVVQGVGGAMMVPVARLTLLYTYPKSQLLQVINFVTIPGLVGPVLGPVLGGWLVEVASWHWIFFINIPIGVIGILFALKVVPNYKKEQPSFDFFGLFLFSIGLVILSLSFEFAGDGFSTIKNIIILFFVGFGLLALYVWYSQKVKNPLIDLKMFRIRTLKIGLLGNLVTRLGVGGVPLMLPLMLQVGFGRSAIISGFMLVFSALASIVAKSWVISMVKKLGYRKLLVSNTLILGISISLFAIPNKESSLLWLIPILIIYGIFNSVQMTAMNSISIADLTNNNATDGNTMLSITQQLSISLGISMSALILRGANSSGVFSDVAHSFKFTFLALGIITLLSSFTFRYLKAEDGAEMSGK